MKAPDYLSDDMKRFWHEIVTGWEPSPDGLRQLETACASWDRWQEARAVIEKEGLVIETRHGVRAHPCVQIERDSKTQFLRALRELNLEAASGVAPEARLPRARGSLS